MRTAILVLALVPALARAQAGGATASDDPGRAERAALRLWEGSGSFALEGRVVRAGRERLTVERDGLPPAVLVVTRKAAIEIDGEKATLGQLERGQEVRVGFDLVGDRVLAVEIRAKDLRRP